MLPIEFIVSASRILCFTECCLECQNCQALSSSSCVFPSLNINITTDLTIWFLSGGSAGSAMYSTNSNDKKTVFRTSISIIHYIVLEYFFTRFTLPVETQVLTKCNSIKLSFIDISYFVIFFSLRWGGRSFKSIFESCKNLI